MSWIAVGLSHDLEPATSAGVLIDGREYVLWRDSEGRAHLWEDRCPHRGMRLSFGFVRGDAIACLYHGWQYDAAGQCRAIPAHPDLDVPNTIRATTYPAYEAGGLIWSDVSGKTPPSQLRIAEEDVTPVRSIAIGCPTSAVATALVAARLPGFSDPSAASVSTEIVPGVWQLESGADLLLVAAQPVDATRTSLHIVVLGAPDRYAGAGQSHFARWAEGLRGRLETGEVAA